MSPELLRAWERRYGLLEPVRSKGGLRLYSADDLERVRTMQRYLDEGMAAAEAAAHALQVEPTKPDAPRTDPEAARRDLGAAVAAFDEAQAQAILDDLLAVGETSVGARVELEHLAASVVGDWVTVLAEVISIDGRRLTFAVEATAEDDRVLARGTVQRVVVDEGRFLTTLSRD